MIELRFSQDIIFSFEGVDSRCIRGNLNLV